MLSKLLLKTDYLGNYTLVSSIIFWGRHFFLREINYLHPSLSSFKSVFCRLEVALDTLVSNSHWEKQWWVQSCLILLISSILNSAALCAAELLEVRGSALLWFCSCLEGRPQNVVQEETFLPQRSYLFNFSVCLPRCLTSTWNCGSHWVVWSMKSTDVLMTQHCFLLFIQVTSMKKCLKSMVNRMRRINWDSVQIRKWSWEESPSATQISSLGPVSYRMLEES